MKFIKIATIFVPIVATASLAYVYVKKQKKLVNNIIHIKIIIRKTYQNLILICFFLYKLANIIKI
ncbi:hypothetical protein ACV3RY_15950 [Clostridium perfringens]